MIVFLVMWAYAITRTREPSPLAFEEYREYAPLLKDEHDSNGEGLQNADECASAIQVAHVIQPSEIRDNNSNSLE